MGTDFDVIDLTMRLTDDTPVYPGDPAVRVSVAANFDDAGFFNTRLSLGSHNGTHIDAEGHMVPGGNTNFPADREAVGRIMAAFPQALVSARANRGFMRRSTQYLAGRGLRQFLDIGTGIPTPPNLHEVAQAVAPEARVVYVDNDPIVLAHAQSLLRSTPKGRTAYLQADLNEPDAILAAVAQENVLDLSRPVALSLNAVLHFIPDHETAYRIVETFKSALVPGSALVLSHATADFTRGADGVVSVYRSVGTSAQVRTRAQVARFFEGWDLVEPEVTTSHRWHPDAQTSISGITDAESSFYVAVAYKIV